MSGNVVTILILAGLAGMVWAANRGVFERPPFTPAPPRHSGATFVLDSTGRPHGASVLVNGVELNSVCGDVSVDFPVGDRPRVTLSVVPVAGVVVALERADLRVDAAHFRSLIEELKELGVSLR